MANKDLRSRFPQASLQLSDDQVGVLARLAREVAFKNGETIIHAGARNPNFYVVKSGTVQVVEYSDGKPSVIWTSYPNELLGDASFLSGRASSLTRVASEDVTLYEISPESLRRVIDEEPQLGSFILKALIARFEITRDMHFTPLMVIGSRFSADAFRIRDFMARNHVTFTWVDLESDEAHGRKILQGLNVREEDTPVVVCRDEWVLSNPANRDLAMRLGILSNPKEDDLYDLAIVGGGPAGLTAAVYAASEGLRTIVLERTAPGGQAGTSSRIENYPGFPAGLSGDELAGRITLQAQKFGAQIIAPCAVQELEIANGYPLLRLDDGKKVLAKCLLIATGASYRRLGVPGCEKYEGVGIYFAATPTEAQVCAGGDVIVVGGANSAGQAAIFLAERTRKVLLLVRGDDLNKGMSRYLSRRIEQTRNIEVMANTEIGQLFGDGHLEKVEVRNNRTNNLREIPAQAVFTFIGAMPHSNWLPSAVATDDRGFIKTGLAVTEVGRWSAPRPRSFWRPASPEYLPQVMCAADR
jgi:thioredoxin reductase (NADPH)